MTDDQAPQSVPPPSESTPAPAPQSGETSAPPTDSPFQAPQMQAVLGSLDHQKPDPASQLNLEE